MGSKGHGIKQYPKLRNELVRQRGRITSLLRQAGKSPPLNYEQFKHLADAALENTESAIQFIDDGWVEDAAICAIHATEYFVAAGEATGLPLINTARKVSSGGRKGHAMEYGTEEEREERNRELQTFLIKLKEQHPEIRSHSALCNNAAEHIDCPHKLSGRTIRDNTENLYK